MIYRLGDRAPQIAEDVFVAPDANLIGDVRLESKSSIWFQTVCRGDNEPIIIGEGANVQDGSVLHTDIGFPLTIGPHVTVGHKVILHGCTIGEGSLVGMGACILNGAKIGKNCVIGAMALVTSGTEIPDNSLVIGSPAKVKRQVTPEELVMLKASATGYILNGARFSKDLAPLDG